MRTCDFWQLPGKRKNWSLVVLRINNRKIAFRILLAQQESIRQKKFQSPPCICVQGDPWKTEDSGRWKILDSLIFFKSVLFLFGDKDLELTKYLGGTNFSWASRDHRKRSGKRRWHRWRKSGGARGRKRPATDFNLIFPKDKKEGFQDSEHGKFFLAYLSFLKEQKFPLLKVSKRKQLLANLHKTT